MGKHSLCAFGNDVQSGLSSYGWAGLKSFKPSRQPGHRPELKTAIAASRPSQADLPEHRSYSWYVGVSFPALAGSNIRCELGPSDPPVDFTFLDIDRLL